VILSQADAILAGYHMNTLNVKGMRKMSQMNESHISISWIHTDDRIRTRSGIQAQGDGNAIIYKREKTNRLDVQVIMVILYEERGD
jgi:hypothetical protein